MNSTIITFDFLKEFKRIHIKLTDDFFNKIKNKILSEYKSISKYNKEFLRINDATLQWEFKKNAYHPFYRILKIIEILKISKEELYNNILGFYHWGSLRNYLQIPKELKIDEFFVEGYALYLAEGDTGFSGNTRPRKFRFTNADINVINHMIKWFNKYFNELPTYIQVDIPISYEN